MYIVDLYIFFHPSESPVFKQVAGPKRLIGRLLPTGSFTNQLDPLITRVIYPENKYPFFAYLGLNLQYLL